MARRLQFQHRMRLDRVEGGKVIRGRAAPFVGHLAAEAAVAQDGADHGRGGGADEPVVVPEEERAGFAGAAVEAVGVLDEGVVGRRLGQRFHGAS